MPETFELPVRGPFSLRAAADFGFGASRYDPPPFDGALRLAFSVDGGQGYAGAVLRQDEADGPVEAELELRDGGSVRAALDQISRVVSLDHDGVEFLRVGRADPVLGALQRAHPGQRPVLFHSPYEAAAWAVIAARRPAAQGVRVRDALSAQLGEAFVLAGEPVGAFPQPRHLADLGETFPGLTLEKMSRLRSIAAAGLSGELDVGHLQALGPEAAFEEVQKLPGIGPFYAALIVLRATGFTDALLPIIEPRVLDHVARFYGLEGAPDLESFAELAQPWRPFRTWATVLIRLAGDRGTVV